MKLYSEMEDSCVHLRGCCIDESDVDRGQASMLQHDAAAAHALMMAMDEWEAEDGFPNNDLLAIKYRAESLLKQWGFDSDEDAR